VAQFQNRHVMKGRTKEYQRCDVTMGSAASPSPYCLLKTYLISVKAIWNMFPDDLMSSIHCIVHPTYVRLMALCVQCQFL